MKLTDAELAEIKGRHGVLRPLDTPTFAEIDRRALLKHIEALEAEFAEYRSLDDNPRVVEARRGALKTKALIAYQLDNDYDKFDAAFKKMEDEYGR